MKWFAAISAVCVMLGMWSVSANTQASSDMIWRADGISVSSLGSVNSQTVSNRHDCVFDDLRVKKLPEPIATVFDNIPVLNGFVYEDHPETCLQQNDHGLFGGDYYSPSSDRLGMLSLGPEPSSTYWFDPAPSGDVVLIASKTSRHNADYRIGIDRQFSSRGDLKKGIVNIEWRHQGVDLLQDKDDDPFAINDHAFSPNGRWLAVRFGRVVAKIDLHTLTMTTVHYMSNPSGELAIGNTGRFIALMHGGLFVLDTQDCEYVYDYGDWDTLQYFAHPGCTMSETFLPVVEAAGLAGIHTQYRRLYFTPDGSGLRVSAGERIDGTTGTTADNYTWQELEITADDYIPPVTSGYLAMGDSFSSGEGDLIGGTWYEPGTDEHGNPDTFEGRNLCHLSRRSYPYLIAMDLGLLTTNLQTPPANGPFHSVACSGAKIHNVNGGGKGVRLLSGSGNDFKDKDNQYLHEYLGFLGSWQPGHNRQSAFLDNYPEGQYPEVISVGIGGNDAGFGNTIMGCLLPGTCKHAVAGSGAASHLAAIIADLKPRLVETYSSILQETNGQTRVYVHGYPVFTSTRGDCALNAPLNSSEILLIDHGIRYMNSVVQAAAQEAGVFYVDVTDILDGMNLCSGADDKTIAFNGITAGDDRSHIVIDLGSRGLCRIRSGCIGSESFHPNHRAHNKYAEAIQAQTANLTSAMPAPVLTPYPAPDEFFGSAARDAVLAANIDGGFIGSQIIIPQPQPFLQYNGLQLTINQGDLLPGSTIQLEVRSDPQLLDSTTVPEDGIYTHDLVLPNDLEPGAHELHLIGTDASGNSIQYVEAIVIGHTSNDFDGDGVQDNEDSCLVIVDSGLDADQDGIDDVCDQGVVSLTQGNSDNQPSVDNPSENIESQMQEGEQIGVLGASTPESLAKTGQNKLVSIIVGVVIGLCGLYVLVKLVSQD